MSEHWFTKIQLWLINERWNVYKAYRFYGVLASYFMYFLAK